MTNADRQIVFTFSLSTKAGKGKNFVTDHDSLFDEFSHLKCYLTGENGTD